MVYVNDHILKVVIINRSDSTGGAAVVSYRLMKALWDAGVEVSMIVVERKHDDYRVQSSSLYIPIPPRVPFLAERLGVFLRNGLRRDTLFRIDTASDGLPLWRHPLVQKADIICLNWVNQGMLSLKGVEKILELGKPVVWTMHDMWNLTGVCHHAGNCDRYLSGCGDCPLIGFPRGPKDISAKTFREKASLYQKALATSGRTSRLTFVAVSEWLASLARKSPLLKEMAVEVIPNAFADEEFPAPGEVVEWRAEAAAGREETSAKTEEAPPKKKDFTVVIGAARLDDPIKGLPLLLKTFSILREMDPGLADRTTLVSFGALRDPQAFEGIAVNHKHLGTLKGAEEVKEVMRRADAVVSSSLYETLPGTLVEAQACGAIPVCFDRGGQSDIIEHRVTGYIAHLEEGDDDASARNLAEGLIWASWVEDSISADMARNVRSKFSSKVIADRYIKLFKKLLASPLPPFKG